MLILVLMLAISGGMTVLVARAHGAGDRNKVSEISGRSTMYMIYAAVIIVMPIGLFASKGILSALGGAPEVVNLGTEYLRIFFLGSIFTMFTFALSALLLGVGKTRVSLVLLIFVNLANIGLNYLFIFGAGPIPAMGVRGAALGTITARGLGSIVGVWILKSPKFLVNIKFSKGLGFDGDLLKKILFLGGPRSLQGIVRNLSRLMTIRIVTLLPFATESVSAYSVGMQVRMIGGYVGLAFLAAATARVGQNMGKGDPQTAEKSGWIAAGMAAIIMSFIAALLLIFPERIMGFFTDDAEVISMGRIFFMTIAVTEPIMAFGFAMSGALRGGGEPMHPFVYASLTDLIVVIAAGYLFAVPLGMGFSGVALGLAIGSVTRSVPTTLRFRKGTWKSVKLLD
jgi:putative MATE family efflux protein